MGTQKSPAFSFYVRDHLCSPTVTAMTGEQVKAYWYLLCNAWLQDATLPTDDVTLAGLARVDLEKWNEIKPLIMTKFSDDGNGRLSNDRQYVEFTKQQHRSTAAAQREHKRRNKDAPSEHHLSTDDTHSQAPCLKTKTKPKTKSPRGMREERI